MTRLDKYYNFIESRRLLEYDVPTHKHHIIPKFMGGEDIDDNLVELSYEDHLEAHLILAECYPDGSREWIGNIKSAEWISHWISEYRDGNDLRKVISKSMRGSKNPNFGGLSTSTKQKLRILATGRLHTDETKIKIGDASRGIKKPPGHGEKIRKFRTGRRRPQWVIDKMRKHMTGKYSGLKNPNCKPVIDNKTGKIYRAMFLVNDEYGVSRSTVWNWLKSGRIEYLEK